MKLNNKRSKTNYSKQKGITLIALVITIVVLLILAGVSINAIFGQNGVIQRARDAQRKMDQAQNSDWDAINSLNDWINGKVIMKATVDGAKAKISFELETAKTMKQWMSDWIEKYTADKSDSEIESDFIKKVNEENSNKTYKDFDDFLVDSNNTRDDLKKIAKESGLSYRTLLVLEGGMIDTGIGYEMFFSYILDLSGIEPNYNRQREIVNDRDKLKATIIQILKYNSFEEFLEKQNLTEEELEQEENLTYNQKLCILTCEAYKPITVKVSNGDSFEVGLDNINSNSPYEYTSSEIGTFTFIATGPKGMTGSIDIEFTTLISIYEKIITINEFNNKMGVVLYPNGETEAFEKNNNSEWISYGPAEAGIKISVNEDGKTVKFENDGTELSGSVTNETIKYCKHEWNDWGSKYTETHRCFKCNRKGYHSNYDWLFDGWLNKCDTNCSDCGHHYSHTWNADTGICQDCSAECTHEGSAGKTTCPICGYKMNSN